MSTLVSVIICTFNRSGSLREALASLAGQTLDRGQFEIVVLDDGSSDDTRDLCLKWSKRLANLVVLSTACNRPLGSARNAATGAAKGDYLLFMDDDCTAAPDWIEAMRRSLERVPIVAGAVAIPRERYIVECHNISQFHRFRPSRAPSAETFIAGANMGLRRSALEAVGGFEEGRVIASDTEFVLRGLAKGHEVWFSPAAVVTHRPRGLNLRGIFRYAVRHAEATIQLRQRFAAVLRTPRLLRRPVFVLLASPLIALKVSAGIYASDRRLLARWPTFPLVYALKLAWCWGAARGLRMQKKIERGI